MGRSARIAYVNCKDDQQLHKIDGLYIRPGTVVKLHQTYPSYVIECEGASIALDREIVSNICVWREPQQFQTVKEEVIEPEGSAGDGAEVSGLNSAEGRRPPTPVNFN